MKRRDFIITSSLAGAGVALGANSAFSAPTIFTTQRASLNTEKGELIFKPFFTQRGRGPHLGSVKSFENIGPAEWDFPSWAFASDTEWDAFYSNIFVSNDGVKISDTNGTWASGDYAVIGTTLQIVGESLAEAADVRAGERVLDVAAGDGNATLAAARRSAQVTSTDYVPALLERGRERARAEGLAVRFQEADVEDLPFPDTSFDVVLSTFGAMFAPDQRRTAAEMMRVLRPGGRIGLASWTPESFIGQLFRVIGRHGPPPAGVAPPAMWGNTTHLAELFGGQAAGKVLERRNFNFRYRSAAHWIEVFRDFYGPVQRAFAALDADGRQALERDVTALLEERDAAGEGALVVPSEYTTTMALKRKRRPPFIA